MEGDSFKARLTQEPYNIPNLHEGDEGTYSIDYVSDWMIHTENGVISPETVYLNCIFIGFIRRIIFKIVKKSTKIR